MRNFFEINLHVDREVLSPFLSPATVLTGEREANLVPRSAAGQAGLSFPLRSSPRRRESGGDSFLCLRCVHSRVGLPRGAVGVVAAVSMWNKCAAASSPLRRGPRWLSRRAVGGVFSQICRSGEFRCSGRGCRGGSDDLAMELLSSRFVSVMVRLAPTLLWSVWRWCSGAPAAAVRGGCCVYRRCPRSVFAGCSSSGARCVEDGGSLGRCPSSSPTESGGALFQGVRGVSPAVFVHRPSSRRPCARRVSPLVLQMMLPWFLGVGFVRVAALVLLFLCLSTDRCGVGRLVGVVMLLL